VLQLKIKLRTKVRREDNLRTEMSDTNKMMVKIRFEGKKLADCDFWTKSDPYLLICRPSRTGKGLIHVRKTETIRNNLNPKWSLIYISLSELCDSDYSLPLQLKVFDDDRNSRDDFIGSAEVSLQELINYSQIGTVITLKKGSQNRGDLLVKQCTVEQDDTDTLRKMSASSYPEKKQSVNFLTNQMSSRQDLHSVPDYSGFTSPSYTAPSYDVPQNPAPSYGVPRNSAPSYGVPQNPAPSYGVPQNPAPSYGVPQNPAPSYGVPQNPAPSYGVPQNPSYGVPQYPASLTSSQSAPSLFLPYPQHTSLPEDPSDNRPASIWI